MTLKQSSMTIAAAALFVATGSVSVSAQESCGNLYNRVMWNYQAHGAQSQEYARISDNYSRRCLAGSSSAPASAYPYAYQQRKTRVPRCSGPLWAEWLATPGMAVTG